MVFALAALSTCDCSWICFPERCVKWRQVPHLWHERKDFRVKWSRVGGMYATAKTRCLHESERRARLIKRCRVLSVLVQTRVETVYQADDRWTWKCSAKWAPNWTRKEENPWILGWRKKDEMRLKSKGAQRITINRNWVELNSNKYLKRKRRRKEINISEEGKSKKKREKEKERAVRKFHGWNDNDEVASKRQNRISGVCSSTELNWKYQVRWEFDRIS